MKDFEKAHTLAREIKTLANTYLHCFSGYQKPAAVSVEHDNFKPATPNQVLAELNKNRRNKRGIDLWKMTVGDHEYPKDIKETLFAQTDYRSNVIFFRPQPRMKKTLPKHA